MSRKPKRKFPHMLDVDVPIWQEWLNKYSQPGDIIQYDVKVGSGITPDPRLSETMKKFSINITKKRIDAVVHRPTEIIIAEVTRRAGLKAIAQMVAYPILYQAAFNPTKTIHPLLVAQKLLTDTEMLLKVLNIDYIIINPKEETAETAAESVSAPEATKDTTK